MLSKDSAGLYAAFKTKDTRFDGRLFVGISSTRIYCRPVCTARKPKKENCTFYSTAAEAEQAGYRPCLLCRPELAPGTSMAEASANIAYKTARRLEKNCGSRQSLEEIAGELGCTDRHLRRVFLSEYSVSPIKYLQTCRLLLAKNLLTDTKLTVLEVAMASGFGSLRRFNDLFKKHYNLTPSALRKNMSNDNKLKCDITLTLGYRPPYNWNQMLTFLSCRAIAGIEVVKNGEYMRTVHLESEEGTQIYGWVRVGNIPKKNSLRVTISETLLSVISQVLARVKHLFDLYCDPNSVYETLHVMNDIMPGICSLGTRVPGCFNIFEMSVRAILGQQITVKAASTLAARIVKNYGIPVPTKIAGLTHVFPSPDNILAMGEKIRDNFGVLGVISARSKAIYELAKSISHGDINFELCTCPEDEINKLMDIQGIGNWTAQYIAMRAIEWTDAFLETDVGIKKALPGYTSKELLKMAEAWRPWRSYATINLWNTL